MSLKIPLFALNLIVKKKNPKTLKFSVGLDFTFNTLRNVKRVNWQQNAPWFRETSDGMSWLGYCNN